MQTGFGIGGNLDESILLVRTSSQARTRPHLGGLGACSGRTRAKRGAAPRLDIAAREGARTLLD